MTLDAIDWKTLTKKQAIALRNAARRREAELRDVVNNGGTEADDEAFRRACLLEENLHVFITLGRVDIATE